MSSLDTSSVHGGEDRCKPFDAITDPVCSTSTFTFPNTAEAIAYAEGASDHFEYGRYGNPNEVTVERKLAALEGAEEAVVFTTGMTALVGLLHAKLKQGDEIIFFDECYRRSRDYCKNDLSKFGVTTIEVKTGDYEALEQAITPRTKLLISESPTNPHLSCIDIAQFVEVAKRHGVETLIDSTFATPYNVQPLSYGVDYVLHSATKYLSGHNNLLAGVVLGSKEKLEPVRTLRGIMGTICSPHTCSQLQQGLKTFALRMERHNQNGQKLAEYLEDHPLINSVYYPGLSSHPYHDVAKKTLKGFGGVVTFLLKDPDWETTANVIDSVEIPRIGPSFGGTESLIEQPYIISYYNYSKAERDRYGIPDNMIRYACGIEDIDDLIADLEQALQKGTLAAKSSSVDSVSSVKRSIPCYNANRAMEPVLW